jgi:hypothetical protein
MEGEMNERCAVYRLQMHEVGGRMDIMENGVLWANHPLDV